ncbi:MAG: hypothetical protein K2Y01_08470 [Rhabdochlamydiaceae bacterium]|nr:hypothetical protein [Rhabdochlamydiaceae bacterium]
MSNEKTHLSSPVKLQRDLHDIEKALEKPVDQKTFQALFKKLTLAQQACSSMKLKCSGTFLSHSEQKICSLFGKVVTSYVDSYINQIVKKAETLSPKDHKAIESLQNEIINLKKDHRPSRENLIKLAEVEKKIGFLQTFSQISEREIDPEESEKLLYLASCVYHKQDKERKETYFTLSETAKERFHTHLFSLKTKPFEENIPTLQALFASADEMAGIPTKYPSITEITEFFLDEPKD